MKVSTIGLDLAKNVFQVHGLDEAGEVIVRKALRRRQVLPFFERLGPCLIGMEACGTSHYWGRELCALGHEVKLMPPAYVKAYVKRGKTDAGDAAAICEAVTRPSMRFVAIKSPDQQSLLAVHRARDLLIRQRTQLVNMIRGQLAEFGIVVAKGIHHALKLVARLLDGETLGLPRLAAKVLITLAEQLDTVLGSSGQGLSGGERRRLCLARAILRDAPILIVDEPFAGLDRQAVERVRETLFELAEDRVVLLIAHDLDHMDALDRILFLEDGRVRGEGVHRELCERFPEYRRSIRGALQPVPSAS